MSGRRPAEPHFSGRATGAVARSPAERLEPTRPAARLRKQRFNREPPASRPLARLLSGLLTLLLLAMVLAGGAAVLLSNQMNAPGPLARSKAVVIPKGEGTHEIAARLERDGVISDRRLFIAGHLLSKMIGWVDSARPAQLKAGDYQMPQAASVRQVIDIIASGKTVSYRVTIPEGLTSHQIVERLKADTNLTGDIAEVPPEGSLLPETFIVQRGAVRQAILDTMQAEVRKVAEKAWAQRRKGLPLKSLEEAIVLASIVEKETGRNDERDRVAAVFINRLRQNMRLQSDPTILYGLGAGKTVWSRPILRSEIAQKTTHNTYQIDGLPPTPICNPGRASIEAVLNPADTKDLFFVADGSGGHAFAETLKEHNANVLKWRAHEKEIRAKTAPPPPPGDTPTTATSKTRAVIRAAPDAQSDKSTGTPKGDPAQANTPAGGAEDSQSWSPTTQPAQPKAKR
jgi:UPF0755 protein